MLYTICQPPESKEISKIEKRRENWGNSHSEILLNNQQSQAQESQNLVINVEDSETENRTENILNNQGQRNEEVELDAIQQPQI